MRIKTKPRALRFVSLFLIMLLLIAPLVSFAEISGNFTVTNNGSQLLPAGSTGNVIMQFDLPAPNADTLLHDGAGYAVATGDTLSTFAAAEKFGDEDHDDDTADYSGTEIIVNSADSTISSAEVITPGTANLTAFTAEYFYLETDADSTYDDGEDIIKMTHDGATVSADGDIIRLFGGSDFYSDADISSDYTNGEMIVSSADANLDNSDTIVTTGMVKHISTFGNPNITFDSTVGGPPYCIFDDVDGNLLVSNNDILIFNCGLALLSDGHTMVCGADAGCGDTLVAMGANRYYIEDNANATYDSGEMIWDDANTNGLLETGEIWQGFSSTALTALSGSTTHFFNDGVAGNSAYDNGEDIFTIYFAGAANNVANGDTLRTIDANEKFSDYDSNGYLTVTAIVGGVSELIANSADAVLSSAEVVTAGYVDVNGFAATIFYHDGSTDGNYTDGEDIVTDDDGSGLYSGTTDKLNSLLIGNPGTCLNTALSGLRIYEDTDGNNSFDGTENQIGTIAASPFWGTSINTAGSATAYSAGSNEQTIFVVADTAVADGSTVCTLTPIIPSAPGNAAQFLSGDDGPTNANVTTTDVTTIDLVPPTPKVVNITTTKTEVAGSAAVANPTDIMTVT